MIINTNKNLVIHGSNSKTVMHDFEVYTFNSYDHFSEIFSFLVRSKKLNKVKKLKSKQFFELEKYFKDTPLMFSQLREGNNIFCFRKYNNEAKKSTDRSKKIRFINIIFSQRLGMYRHHVTGEELVMTDKTYFYLPA